MASVGEVKAIAARMREEFGEVRGQVDGMRNVVSRLGGEAQNVLSDSNQETAQAVIACAYAAETAMDDAITNIGLAMESLEQFGAGL